MTSILLHHRDIQGLLQVCLLFVCSSQPLTPVQVDEEETIRLLEESRVVERVEIDEHGGKL